MPKQIHQRVDAHLGVGELGDERVTQPVQQLPAGSLAVDAGFLEGAQQVLQGSARNAFALCVDEQQCVRWPGGQSPGGGVAFGGGGEPPQELSERNERKYRNTSVPDLVRMPELGDDRRVDRTRRNSPCGRRDGHSN